MVIWKQTSLFAYKDDLTLENIIPFIKFLGEPTPYALVRKGIEKFSKSGDLVLDPGCGNGTTGVIAIELKRKTVLTDVNQLATRYVGTLYHFLDNQKIREEWERLVLNLPQLIKEDAVEWDKFINSSLPQSSAFKSVQKKNECVRDLFREIDLEILKGIYLGIEQVKDSEIRDFLRVVFDISLLDNSQLTVNRQRQSFSLPRTPESKDPVDIVQEKLELFLTYQSLIHKLLKEQGVKSPKTYLASASHLSPLADDCVDYVLYHLPGVQGALLSDLTFFGERLRGVETDPKAEMVIELDYRGRFRLLRELADVLKELDRVLKENGYVTLIFSGHYVLLSLIIRVAQNEGWQLVQGEVEMVKGGLTEDYPVMSVTLQKKRTHTVLGALNKMKVETLYDTEEAILRKIDQYLTEHGMATLEEIQRHLIENYLHDCLIEKPLNDLLGENYLFSGKYWLKPSNEQKEELVAKRQEVMQKEFPEFIREMVYSYIQEEKTAATYEELIEWFLQIRPRTVFRTPYYRLLAEQCERKTIKLNQLIQEYFEGLRKEPFETLTQVLRRIIKADEAFIEIVPAESVGLSEWPLDHQFKIYLELFEKAKKNRNLRHYQSLSKKVLELLPDVSYLDDRKKERIREYIVRSEGV